MRNRSSSGEVPPIIKLAHNSSRIAPPRSALTADSTEWVQTFQNRFHFLLLLRDRITLGKLCDSIHTVIGYLYHQKPYRSTQVFSAFCTIKIRCFHINKPLPCFVCREVIYSIFRIMAADLDHAANTVDRCTDIMALTDICRPYSQKILRVFGCFFLWLSCLCQFV